MLTTTLLALSILLSPLAHAQDEGPATASEAMAPLAFLVGEWEGTGWIQMGPGEPHRFVQRETVEARLDGDVLLIEGVGHAPDDEDEVVHHAFAVLAYDSAEERYLMRAFRKNAAGQTLAVEGDAAVEDGALVWGFEIERVGTVRYTIREDEEGRWHETGEMTRDGGETWHPFFEMTLERVE